MIVRFLLIYHNVDDIIMNIPSQMLQKISTQNASLLCLQCLRKVFVQCTIQTTLTYVHNKLISMLALSTVMSPNIFITALCHIIPVSLGTLVPNSRDRQGKLWLPKKQKTALKTTLQ